MEPRTWVRQQGGTQIMQDGRWLYSVHGNEAGKWFLHRRRATRPSEKWSFLGSAESEEAAKALVAQWK